MNRWPHCAAGFARRICFLQFALPLCLSVSGGVEAQETNAWRAEWDKLYPKCIAKQGAADLRYSKQAIESYCRCSMTKVVDLSLKEQAEKRPPPEAELRKLGAAIFQCKLRHLELLGPKEHLTGESRAAFMVQFSRGCFVSRRKAIDTVNLSDESIERHCKCLSAEFVDSVSVEDLVAMGNPETFKGRHFDAAAVCKQ